jgi:hypothetical protein
MPTSGFINDREKIIKTSAGSNRKYGSVKGTANVFNKSEEQLPV